MSKEHKIVYRAVAEFGDLIRRSREAREELERQQKAQESLNAARRDDSQAAEMRSRLARATREAADSTDDLADSTRRAASGHDDLSGAIRGAADEVSDLADEVSGLGDSHDGASNSARRNRREHESFGSTVVRIFRSVASAASSAWQAVDAGVPSLRRLGIAARAGIGTLLAELGGFEGIAASVTGGLNSIASASTSFLAAFAGWGGIILLVAASMNTLVTVLASLAAPLLAGTNALVSMSAVLAAVPGLAFAAASGIGALFAAIQPIGNVFKTFAAVLKQTEGAAASSGEAVSQSADRVRSASRNAQSASRGISDAMYEEKRAREQLNDAYRQATRELEDLEEKVAKGSLNEAEAALNLRQAMDAFLREQANPLASADDIEAARLRVVRAQWAVRDANRDSRRNAEDLALAERRGGVEGSSSVVAARRQVAMAERQVADARYAASEASRQLAQAQKEAAVGGTAAAKAQAEYEAALKKLSPSARAVVLELIGMRSSWKDIQQATQESVFAPVAKEMGSLKELIPVVKNLLTSAGGAAGDFIGKLLKLVSSGPWKSDFGKLAAENAYIIEKLGNMVLFLADGFRHINVAAAPFTRWLVEALERSGKSFDQWAQRGRNLGTFEAYLAKTTERLQVTGRILHNLGSVFFNWFVAAAQFTDWTGDRLERMTARWAESARRQTEAGSPFKKWLEDVKPLLTTIAELLGKVMRGIASIGSDPDNITQASRMLKILKDDILPGLRRIFDQLAKSGGLEAFGDAIGKALNAIATFFEKGGGQAFATFVITLSKFVEIFATILSWGPIPKILGGIAVALAAIAAASLVAKFTGLLWLAGQLGNIRSIAQWFIANRGNYAAALRALALGTPTNTVTPTPTPSPAPIPTPGGAPTPAVPTTGVAPVAGGAGQASAATALSAAAAELSAAARLLMEAAAALLRAATASAVGSVVSSRSAASSAASAAAASRGLPYVGAAGAAGAATAASRGLVPYGGGMAPYAGQPWWFRPSPGTGLMPYGGTGVVPGGAPWYSYSWGAPMRGGAPAIGASGAMVPAGAAGAGIAQSAGQPWRYVNNARVIEGELAAGSGAAAGASRASRFAGLGRFAGGGASIAAILASIFGPSTSSAIGDDAARGLTGAGLGFSFGGPIGAAAGAAAGLSYGSYFDIITGRNGARTDPSRYIGLINPLSNLSRPIARGIRGLGDGAVGRGVDSVVGAITGASAGGMGGLASSFSSFIDEDILKPIQSFFSGIGKTILGLPKATGKLIDEKLLSPISEFFSSIGSSIGKQAGRVISFVYDKAIRPWLAIFLGVNDAFNYYAGKVLSWVNENVVVPIGNFFISIGKFIYGARSTAETWVVDNILKPIGGFFVFIGTSIYNLYSSAETWVVDHILRPIGGFFLFIGTSIYNLYSTAETWVVTHLLNPVGGFFVSIATKIYGLYSAAETWVQVHIFSPIAGFFRSIGNFLINIPTMIERWAETLPGVGRFIRERNEQLGGGRASGGMIYAPGDGSRDTILTPTANQEFIVRSRAVRQSRGQQLLEEFNSGRLTADQIYNSLDFTNRLGTATLSAINPVVPALAASVPGGIPGSGEISGGGFSVQGDLIVNNPVKMETKTSLRRAVQILQTPGGGRR